MQELITYLNENLHVQKVYMNEESGWLFYPHPSFKIEVLRSEILKQKVEEKIQVIEPKKEVVKTKKTIKQN
jgi:hypothetical protein